MYTVDDNLIDKEQKQANSSSPPSSGLGIQTIKTIYPDTKLPEPSTLTFEADTIFIGSENLCLGFKDAPWNMEKITKLVFKMGDKIYTYHRAKGRES